MFSSCFDCFIYFFPQYKHEPLNKDPFSTSTREQQNDPINFGGSVKPAGRHFDLGNTQIQNMFEVTFKDLLYLIT